MTRKKIWKISFVGILLILLIICWANFIGFSGKKIGADFNSEHNAVWISHKWVGESVEDKDIERLVVTLKANQIDTVFVHSGPFMSDGTVDVSTYEYAERFLEKARKYDKDIKYQAWLGQIRSSIDLSDPYVRNNIVKQSQIFSMMIGFDGIHIDIEPVWDKDEDFIKLLKEIDEILPEDKKLSVALAEFIPKNLVYVMKAFKELNNYNSETNYENVAKYADRIVVMVYDLGFESDWFYRWIVREQTIRTSRLFDKNLGKEIFIAIPSYNEEKENFNPKIENVENGMKGLINGLNNSRMRLENFAGVAIYSYWETDQSEWDTYYNLWIKE